MNKKLLFGSAAIIAGFVTLTAFGGKTLKEQQAGIAEEVTAKLEMLRSELTATCDARVAEAAAAKATELMAAAVPAAPGKAPAKTVVKKKAGGSKGGGVDPLPQGPTPTAPVTGDDKAKSRMNGETGKEDESKAKSRMNGEGGKTEEQKAKSRIGGGGGK